MLTIPEHREAIQSIMQLIVRIDLAQATSYTFSSLSNGGLIIVVVVAYVTINQIALIRVLLVWFINLVQIEIDFVLHLVHDIDEELLKQWCPVGDLNDVRCETNSLNRI